MSKRNRKVGLTLEEKPLTIDDLCTKEERLASGDELPDSGDYDWGADEDDQ